jgi:hypothetical protein
MIQPNFRSLHLTLVQPTGNKPNSIFQLYSFYSPLFINILDKIVQPTRPN